MIRICIPYSSVNKVSDAIRSNKLYSTSNVIVEQSAMYLFVFINIQYDPN
jgi:hypothetical protein